MSTKLEPKTKAMFAFANDSSFNPTPFCQALLKSTGLYQIAPRAKLAMAATTNARKLMFDISIVVSLK
jgi:hypothetical protein